MKDLRLALSSTAITVGLFLTSPLNALAQSPIPTQGQINLGPQGDFQALGGITFTSLISGGIKLVLVLAAIIFFFVLVIGGIQWIVSGGDKTGAETARKRITAALVGLAIVFVAWAIGSLVNSLFGVNIFQLNIPSFQPSAPVGRGYP